MTADEEAREALAAEYVLGTLAAAEAERVRARLPLDAGLRDAVARWEARLAPLQALCPAEAPPPGLWERVEASFRQAGAQDPAAAMTPLAASVERRPRPGLGWAWGGGAIAAGIAAVLLLRPAPAPQLMTVLLTERDQPAFLVEAGRDGGLSLAAVNRPAAVEAGRVRQLWALPPGATAPISLGLLPAEAGRFSVAPGLVKPEAGMLVEITLEPAGGSPTGRPTGPILFIGRLAPARGT